MTDANDARAVLVEAANVAFAAAQGALMCRYGVGLIVIAVDPGLTTADPAGAYQIRANAMNVNTVVGVLMRAAFACTNIHTTPHILSGGSGWHPAANSPPNSSEVSPDPIQTVAGAVVEDRFENGDKVRTLQLSARKPGEWQPGAELMCRWGETGTIMHVSDSHGLCYEVEHEDGYAAWYEPVELELIPESPPSIGDNKPAGEL